LSRILCHFASVGLSGGIHPASPKRIFNVLAQWRYHS